ncbi:MAG: chromosome segregation protein SMC, partial [Rubrivivax sp.]
QQIQVLAAESRSVDEQARQLAQRRERLVQEDKGLAAPDEARLADLQRQGADAARQGAEADAALEALAAEVPELDARRRAQQETASAEASRQAGIAARLDALRTLQDKVQTEGKLKPWLQRHGLDGLQGLWTKIHIEPGWEPALEAALRERLGALAVGRIETVSAFVDDAPPARLAFYTVPSAPIPNTHRTLPRLADLLRLSDPGLQALLGDWLEGVYTAPSMAEALAARVQLTHGEVVMTAAGHAVSAFAVSFYAPDSEQAGLLARAQEIENLALQLRAQSLIADEARSVLVRSEAAYTEASQRLTQARRDAAERQTRAHRIQVELLRLTEQAQATQSRRVRLAEELAEIDTQSEALEQRRLAAETRFEALDQQLGTLQERDAECGEAVHAAERALAAARDELRATERRAQEAQFAARSLDARRAEVERSLAAAGQQLEANAAAAQQLRAELETLGDAADRAALDAALAVRVERERALGAQRSAYDELSRDLKRTDERRLVCERGLQPMRDAIVKLQLEEQAAALGGAQYLELLTAAEVDLEALGKGVADSGVRLSGLQAEIDRIHREIAALGAVNLAALDELGASRERKTFLDAQMADLQEAITTLEGAIHKIDLETRELLASTFEAVNGHFGRMFPVLFGGGNARLVMTGDEILDAGVQVMAQPPGKKNSSIHLLSGGEKALTAIALVFAIFQLNPAPFCLLDEVDAPLDDANTDRYAALVKEMAQSTQFLFISHNKIAMEMAEQLVGVTMQEQGVSRIVAVDMTTAVGLAEAA